MEMPSWTGVMVRTMRTGMPALLSIDSRTLSSISEFIRRWKARPRGLGGWDGSVLVVMGLVGLRLGGGMGGMRERGHRPGYGRCGRRFSPVRGAWGPGAGSRLGRAAAR